MQGFEEEWVHGFGVKSPDFRRFRSIRKSDCGKKLESGVVVRFLIFGLEEIDTMPRRGSVMADPTPSPNPTAPRFRRPWILSFFSLLALAGLGALPFMAFRPEIQNMSETLRFIGRFHPLLLHLPIGVFALILIQEIGSIFFRRAQPDRFAPIFPMFFGAASAIVAVAAGLFLYHGGGYENNAIAERHLWGGLAFAMLAVLTFIARAWTAAPMANPAVFRLLLFISAGVMAFASHDGATLTHGDKYLTEFAPEPLRKLLGLPAKAPAVAAKAVPDQVVYADIVAPILERRCVQCHKDGKNKGGVRMDTYELLMKGSKKGPIIIPGDPAKSQLVQLVELPVDDIDHMPPAGKPQPTKEELAVLKWWIEKGADATKTVKALEPTPEIAAAISTLAPAAAAPAVAAPAAATDKPAPAPAPTTEPAPAPVEPAPPPAAVVPGPDEVMKTAVAALAKEFPGSVTFESQESKGITLTAASLRGTLDDAAFAKFAPVLPQLVTADLSATKITDLAVSQLAAATNLRQIRLAETAVTDAAIETLLKLPALESVNLYGTKVTDAGAVKLAALPKLKHLYLWQTAVTPATVTALREKLPQCEIVTGVTP